MANRPSHAVMRLRERGIMMVGVRTRAILTLPRRLFSRNAGYSVRLEGRNPLISPRYRGADSRKLRGTCSAFPAAPRLRHQIRQLKRRLGSAHAIDPAGSSPTPVTTTHEPH